MSLFIRSQDSAPPTRTRWRASLYQRLGRGLPGWVLVLLLTLPALHPLLRAELPRGGDTGLHLYRLVELDHCLRQGLLFPRWMPDLVYGYGYPLFNFYAPLSTYLTETLHLLGLALVPALRVGFILCLLGSGLAMYLFAREVFGERAGLIAAVAYVYAPYLLYNHYVRGSLSDALAFVWFPLVFWAFRRLALKGEERYIVLGAVTYAALVLTHNVSSLAATPVLLLYLLALGMWRRRAFPWRAVLAALLLGLALSAFFWLPALAEKQFTRIELFMAAPEYDYRLNFLTPGELLAPPSPVDTGCMNPDIPIQIGLAQTVFGALAIALLGRLQGEQRWSVIAFTLAVIGLDFMTLSPSEWLWARLPLIRMTNVNLEPGDLRPGPAGRRGDGRAGGNFYPPPGCSRGDRFSRGDLLRRQRAVPLPALQSTASTQSHPGRRDRFSAAEPRPGRHLRRGVRAPLGH